MGLHTFHLLPVLESYQSSLNMRLSSSLSALVFAAAVLAHPGEIEEYGTPARREFLDNAKRSIANCGAEIYARGDESGAVARRAELARTLREARGLPTREYIDKRDFATVLNTTHHSNKTHLSLFSPSKDIFTGELQCVLQPEVTEGPYCIFF